MVARPLIRLTVVLVCALLIVTPLAAAARIVPPQAHPNGRTYGAWAAAWWQWALETPASVSPLLDPTGERCAEGQSGHTWFLAGSFGSNETITRACTIPAGTALFFPLLNAAYFAFLSDPPEQRTEEFLRAQAACSTPTHLTVTIDGRAVEDPLSYFEQSPLFDVQLPEDNVFGVGAELVPELRLSPSVDQGYYLYINPLAPGEHLLQWSGTWTCPFASEPFTENVTYTITVAPRSQR